MRMHRPVQVRWIDPVGAGDWRREGSFRLHTSGTFSVTVLPPVRIWPPPFDEDGDFWQKLGLLVGLIQVLRRDPVFLYAEAV